MVKIDGFTYYTMDKIKQKDALFNAIISARTGGKTFSAKLNMIENGLKGHRFVYTRRRDKEIEAKKMLGFFDKIQAKGYYTDCEFKWDKGYFFAGDKMIGYTTAVSTSVNDRSVDFVNVSDIYYEEFVLKEDAQHRYLEDEVFKFLELYTTIARNDEVKVWFIGNKIREFNPYFLYFDIIPPKQGIKVYNDFAVEVWKNEHFVEERKKTRFGKLIDGTAYADYAIENEAYEDGSSFIQKLPTRSIPFFRIEHMGSLYMVWRRYDGCLHIGGDVNVKVGYNVTTDENKVSPQLISTKNFRNTPFGKNYVLNLRKNQIYYTTSKVEEVGRFFNKKMYFGR